MAINLNGNSDIRSIHYNGTDLTSVTFNDVVVWRKGSVLDNISNLSVNDTSYTSATLKYTIPKNATGVTIYYNTTSNVSSSNYLGSAISSTGTCEISGLSINTTYYFVAYAYNSLTTADKSNIVNTKTLNVDTTAIDDWEYETNDNSQSITLLTYIGKNKSTVTIHPFYYVNGINYKTYIKWSLFSSQNNLSGLSKIKKVIFENEVKLIDSDALRGLFAQSNDGEDLSSLEEVDLSGLNIENATSTLNMFTAPKLKTIKGFSIFNKNKITDFRSMFLNCPSLTSLDLSDFNTENGVKFGGMFSSCNQLQALDLRNFDTRKATDMDWMFNNCPKLKYIYVSDKWSTSQANTDYMFYKCGTSSVTKV